MALDFPTSPSLGQLYPSPPVAGQPVYKWDGEKWAVSSSSGVIYAPFDAMAYSGMQVNGGMEVSQENGTSAVVVSSTKYILDGWMLGTSGAQVLPVSQQLNGPAGFVKSAYVSVSTANASPAAGNYCFFYQPIEGYRVSRLAWGTAAAQPITVSFWVATNRTGAFSGSIRNGASDRAYPFSFTMNAVGAWEYKTVSIPGDTTGTWAKDNTIGLTVSIALMCGSGQTAPANAWVSGGYIGVTGTTNGVASTTDYMYLTGLVVLPGTQAPTAAQSMNVMRPYDQELVTCKRYYNILSGVARIGNGVVSGYDGYTLSYPEMRAAPTAALSGFSYTANSNSAAFGPITTTGGRIYVVTPAAGQFDYSGGIVKLDARL